MQKVLITGATGSIGEAIVEKFAKEGYYIYIHYSSNEQKAKELLNKIDGQGSILTFNVQNREDIKQKLKDIEIDVLINNLGITKDNLFFWMSDEEWEEVIDTNLNGIFRVTKALLANMIKKKNCSIVNLSSIAGLAGNMGQANYATTKGGIISFTKTLALELARYKIRVNCVAPGLIKSNMTKEINEESLKQSIPLNRFGEPAEVAHAVYFAATNKYMTAEVINISGGMVR